MVHLDERENQDIPEAPEILIALEEEDRELFFGPSQEETSLAPAKSGELASIRPVQDSGVWGEEERRRISAFFRLLDRWDRQLNLAREAA